MIRWALWSAAASPDGTTTCLPAGRHRFGSRAAGRPEAKAAAWSLHPTARPSATTECSACPAPAAQGGHGGAGGQEEERRGLGEVAAGR